MELNYFDMAIKLFMACLLVVCFRQYFKLVFKIKVFNDIQKIRFKRELQDQIQTTPGDMKKLYYGTLADERREVKEYLLRKYNDKTPLFIDSLLNDFYPEFNK